MLAGLLIAALGGALGYVALRERAAAGRRTTAAEATVIKVENYGTTHKKITYSFAVGGGA